MNQVNGPRIPAARDESNFPLPYTSGFENGTSKLFAAASRGLAHLDLRLTPPAPRHRTVRH